MSSFGRPWLTGFEDSSSCRHLSGAILGAMAADLLEAALPRLRAGGEPFRRLRKLDTLLGGGSASAFQHRRRRRGSALQVCDLSFNFRRSGERIVRERLR